jgi:hypothetical protein
VVVKHVLQVWRCLLTRSSQVEGAEARIAFMDKHHRLVEGHGLPDLELACDV